MDRRGVDRRGVDRRTLLALALAVGGLAAISGGFVLYEVPDQHVHDARADIGEAVYDEESGDVNRSALGGFLENATIVDYGNLSTTGTELYLAAARSDETHRTPVGVGAPAFDYSMRTVEGPEGEQRETGHRTVIVHTDESLDALPPGYDPGHVDAIVTRTEQAPLGSGHHVPRVAALFAGAMGIVAAGRLWLT